MIVNFVKAHPELIMADIDLWKTNLRGAYTLMSFKASNCMKFAVELVGGITIIFLCGLLGWSSTPAAFQVITRAIIFELGQILLGVALMYVDDIMGVSKRTDLEHDLGAARGVCTELLGEHAVQDEKTLFTTVKDRRLDVIGYTINLEKQVVTMSRRNLLKNMYLCFRHGHQSSSHGSDYGDDRGTSFQVFGYLSRDATIFEGFARELQGFNEQKS